ncbi:MAG TPA: hypothetical protein VFZ24_15665 [Longimicrobiales bacterium]
MSNVILGSAAGAKAATRAQRVPAGLFLALGLAITAVGFIDLGFAWFPWRFGNGEWEFGTVSRTFDSLALVSVGIGLVAAAAVSRPSRWLIGTVAAVATIVLLGLLGSILIYALNLPVALRAVPAGASGALQRAVMRTSGFMLVYVAFYTWLTVYGWRSFRLSRE